MYQEIRTDFIFSIGEVVKWGELKCKIIRRWSTMQRVNDDLYYLTRYYTVKPETKQRFKVVEEDLHRPGEVSF